MRMKLAEKERQSLVLGGDTRWLMVGALTVVFAIGVLVGFGAGRWLPTIPPEEGRVVAGGVEPTAEPTEEPTLTPVEITMIAVGDVMLGRSVREQMIARNDWTWPWLEVGEKLKSVDITIGNLESQIVTG